MLFPSHLGLISISRRLYELEMYETSHTILFHLSRTWRIEALHLFPRTEQIFHPLLSRRHLGRLLCRRRDCVPPLLLCD